MLQSYFKLSENNTSIRNEFIGGLTSFLATFYIIIVNPAILSQAGMPAPAVTTATILITFFSTLLMGIYSKNPIVVAPGMGLNAFFTYSVVIGGGHDYHTALGAVFLSGIIFILLSIFNLRVKVLDSIPLNLRNALAAGIGFFITFIGLINGGIIVKNPATFVALGPVVPTMAIFFIGLFATAYMYEKKFSGSLILGIIFTSVLSYPIGRWFGEAGHLAVGAKTLSTYSGIFSMPDFSLIMQMNVKAAFQASMIGVLFSFVFTDLFDSLSTFVGVAEAGNLKDQDGRPFNVKQSLLADAVATVFSGVLGSSPATSYIESAAGIHAGARTGLASVFTAILFLPFLFFTPLLSTIPMFATSPILVLVGLFMIRPMAKIPWDQFDEALPCFLAIILIPLTFSITQGIIWGFVSYTILKVLLGKYKQLPLSIYVIFVLCLFALFFHS